MDYVQHAGILLPPLEIPPIKTTIGLIRHQLKSGGPKTIVRVGTINISARVTQKVYYLSDHQAVIITAKSRCQRPSQIDGILQELPDQTLKWISHRLIDHVQKAITEKGLAAVSQEILESWSGVFRYNTEKRASGVIVRKGLRSPQIGGLHAIGAHWSVYNQPATLIMPTGTGKTETMLAAFVSEQPGRMLVVVPSRVIGDQTVRKFISLGLLRLLGAVSPDIRNPIVGTVLKRPKLKTDLEIFKCCNVVISTMSAVADESALHLTRDIAGIVETLIVDEAHHIAAPGWLGFREHFKDKQKVLQFTATPYRRDGKLVDGRVIFDYPLHVAQQEGYFKRINFEPVYEIDDLEGDRAIARRAVEQLDKDLQSGKDHLVMARCSNISRANDLLKMYQAQGSKYSPVVIHSESEEVAQLLAGVENRKHRILVCVDMLGEGFDLPNLKIAAVHDTHKSLAVLLQFTGRFTRSADDTIGEATVIANIANQEISAALERLYSEDADWNTLLNEFSSEAAKSHARLIEFLQQSRRVDDFADDDKIEISQNLLRPTFNTMFYECSNFTPNQFIHGLPTAYHVQRLWHHMPTNTTYFVTRLDLPIRWSRSKTLRDREWHLFVLHFQPDKNLLYIATSDKSSMHQSLAHSVGGTRLLSGDIIFRSLGNINRLIFQQVGVKKHGRRNLRYAMYTGGDVAEALSISEKTGSEKSNLSGTGWEDGNHITIGCSYKGRVWARDPGTIPELIEWCEHVGHKILDSSINTTDIIANVLIPEEVTAFPDKIVLSVEWPLEVVKQAEDRVMLKGIKGQQHVGFFSIEIQTVDRAANNVDFTLRSDIGDIWVTLQLHVGGEGGFKVLLLSAHSVFIKIGKYERPIEQFFNDYPPLIRFVDLSELDGNLLIRPQAARELEFPMERLEVWDWTGINIQFESIIKEQTIRKNSVQWKVATEYIKNGFDVVFNDDNSGEVADLIGLKDEHDHIRLALLHCKFSKGESSGERVVDVVEVSSQAVRSAKWKWKFKDLCHHILEREKRLRSPVTGTRFLQGSAKSINHFAKLSRFKEIRPEIVIVQPGISRNALTPDQIVLLAAAYSYLKETIGVDLDVVCSE
jgi:superfamily II DNA or RNA helicase